MMSHMKLNRCNCDDAAKAGGRYLNWWKAALLWAVICVLAVAPRHGFSQTDGDGEYRVKLAFLYNFAQFVQWPDSAFQNANSPLTLCVAGQDPFQGEIEQSLRGRAVGGHPIEIRRLRATDEPRACHMIFVPAGETRLAERILARVKGSSVLTVGETKGFADFGGIINLTLNQNKLRFEVNLDAATQTQLKISSRLLALAKIVKVEDSK